MPQFRITAPDGRVFNVTGPEGSTKEEALARVQGQHAGAGRPFDGAPPQAQEMGEFKKGVGRGIENMQGMTYGFAALLGDTIGHDGLTDWGLENYERNQKEAARFAPKLGSFREIDSAGDFFSYTASVLGETAPFTLTTIAGGGLGGLLTRAVAPRLIAKKIGEETAKKAVERILKDEAAKKVLTKAVNTWTKRGALTGSFAASAATQQGGLYGELVDAGVEEAVLPAWIFGAGMGALDVAPEALLANAVLNPKKVAKDLSKSFARGVAERVGKTAATQTVAEGLTEGAQEALAVLARVSSDDTFNWDDQANERVLDNVVAGAIAGLFMGAGGAGIAELTRKRDDRRSNKPKPEAPPRPVRQPADSSGVGPAPGAPPPGGAAAEPGPAGAPAPVREQVDETTAAPAAPAAEPVAPVPETAAEAPAAEAPVAAGPSENVGPGVPSRVSEEQDPYWAELAADSNRRFGEPLPSTDPRLVAAQAAARERLANPQPMDPRFGGTLVEEGENAAPPEGEPAPQAAEQPASESTVAPTDNSVVQSARRLTAEISDLANKSTPRRAVWVSAESLQHPPVAAIGRSARAGPPAGAPAAVPDQRASSAREG